MLLQPTPNLSSEIMDFLKSLREQLMVAFASLDSSAFERKKWSYAKGEGGGEMALLRGAVFEKAAVNFSAIKGREFPMQDAAGPFFAMGVSLITHMSNPHAPTVHMNLRYMQTQERFWFGGGYDLTPMGFFYAEDKEHFHLVAKKNLDRFDKALYPLFSQQARDYFFIPHHNKERGVGGIFFDHYCSGNYLRDFSLWKGIGESLLDAIMPIYQRRISLPYTQEEKQRQLQWRAHYVEFNLLYDRGTKFGFQSGGNPEAILASLPPLASW